MITHLGINSLKRCIRTFCKKSISSIKRHKIGFKYVEKCSVRIWKHITFFPNLQIQYYSNSSWNMSLKLSKLSYNIHIVYKCSNMH